MSETYEKVSLLSVKAPYNPELFLTRLAELLEKHNESYREAGLRSGLDHYAVNRFFQGSRPGMPACILLAEHYDLNPNEIITLAGWPRLKAFDLYIEGKENLPPEATQVALELARIEDDVQRKQVAEAVKSLLRLFTNE